MKQGYLLFLMAIYCSIAINASGPSSLDTSFNTTGITANLFAAYTTNVAQNMAIQTDNKCILIGASGDNAIIARYNNDGSLDQTFNPTGSTPGIVTIILTTATQSSIYGIAIQPTDGKILVAGYVIFNNISNAFIARYTTDGFLDTSFGGAGSGYITTVFETSSQLYGIALQDDGSIVVTGWAIEFTGGQSQALVARYTSAGILDTTFNTTGYIITLLGTVFTKAFDIALQSDGSIVVVGNAILNNEQQLIVIRYTTDGALDTTFNSSGMVTIPGSAAPLNEFLLSSGNSLIIQPADQKIILVGTTNLTQTGFSNQLFTLVRLETDGALDPTFNTTGYFISDIGIEATDLVLQSDNKIVTSGYDYTNEYVLIINRFTTNGTIDPTFNYSVNATNLNSIGNAIALLENGKIVVSGTITVPYIA